MKKFPLLAILFFLTACVSSEYALNDGGEGAKGRFVQSRRNAPQGSGLAETNDPGSAVNPPTQSRPLGPREEKNRIAGHKAFQRHDYEKAFHFLNPLAEAGHASSQFMIGMMYHEGLFVQKDFKEAAKWLLLSAQQGVQDAQFMMGELYAYGRGVAVDDVTAVKWYRLAADKGDPDAQIELGRMYRQGKGGLYVNYALAMKYFRMAADQGTARGQVHVGIMFHLGEGVPVNYAEALRWYKMAADQGFASGQSLVCRVYYFGEGVEKSWDDAVEWCRRAAEQGDGAGQLWLGALYAEGLGVRKDLVTALMWMELAAAQGYEGAEQMSGDLRKRMTKAQVAEAQRLSRNWQPRKEAHASATAPAPAPAPAPRPPPSRGKSRAAKRGKGTPSVSSGTGFFVSKDGRILTNYHVVEGCEDFLIRERVGLTAAARVIAVDKNADLALLSMEGQATAVATFRNGSSPQIGEEVVVFGYPLAGLLASSGNLVTGNISAMAGMGNDPRLYQISAPVQPGNSGGPLVDDNGQVIGVIVSKLNVARIASAVGDLPQNINFAIKGSVARNFLEASDVTPSAASGRGKMSPVAIAKEAKKYTVQIFCQ